jgi:hypothetical protein
VGLRQIVRECIQGEVLRKEEREKNGIAKEGKEERGGGGKEYVSEKVGKHAWSVRKRGRNG